MYCSGLQSGARCLRAHAIGLPVVSFRGGARDRPRLAAVILLRSDQCQLIIRADARSAWAWKKRRFGAQEGSSSFIPRASLLKIALGVEVLRRADRGRQNPNGTPAARCCCLWC
jgi:hypothetical protein